ncbi:MAG: EAL domain-containing protein [Pseudomonadota bacterium]|nr:EAL domain-containing protein [Pseudomonadota bacterium]MDP1904849.1 EAL domain-containing protein [Pseudomonadota bacterium]MDP2354332.1 EAL domain-containing protein [Pseudomonadota bacterium]
MPPNSSSLRRVLLTRMAGLVVGTAFMVGAGLVILGLTPVTERIAESQFRAAATRVEASLDALFKPADAMLTMAGGWIAGEVPDLESSAAFNHLFQPVLRAIPQATSIVAGTSDGQAWLLLQQIDGSWRNRMTDRARWDDRHLLIDRGADGREIRQWARLDYDARTRPWFKAAAAAPIGERVWTSPYLFFTTGEPGITASTRLRLNDGRDFVVGVDLKLRDLSRATMDARVGQRGLALVLTEDGRLLALPAMPKGMRQIEWMRHILRPAEKTGIAVLDAVLASRPALTRAGDVVWSFRGNNEAWLASMRPYRLGEQRLQVLTLAPASDFAPQWLPLLVVLAGALLALLGLAIMIARAQARRIAESLEALAAASERIGCLDFSVAPVSRSGIAEIDRLAAAQHGMRDLLWENQATLSTQADDLRARIEALHQAKASLRESDEYNKVLFADSGIPLVVLDPESGRFIDCNAAAARIYRLANREAVLGLTPAEVSASVQYDGRDTATAAREYIEVALVRGSHVFEWRHRRADGEEWDAEVRLMAFRHAGRTLLQFSLQDITERKQAEQQLEYLAFHDVLTDLPNRVLLLDRLQLALAAAQRRQGKVGLLLLDLDRFKEINDSQGHSMGDAALVEVARRFQALLRQGESIARVGGDEFVVLAPDADQAAVVSIAERLLAALSAPLEVKGQHFTLGVSIGIAISPADGDTAEVLMRHADVAMYRAKAAGGGYRFYSPEMSAGLIERMALARDLKAALRAQADTEEGALSLHFQPQVSLRDGVLLGAEALMRWRRGDDMISPAVFITIAEERGMMCELGAWVLRQACRQLKAWRAAGTPLRGRLAINIAVQQIESVVFPEQAEAIIRDAGLEPALFELELTESGFMHNIDLALANVNRLQAAGFAFAIDDFGTGYSSLAYLKRLPVDKIKIDISFVRDMLVDRNDHAIVNTIIGMGRTLELTTIAEGVESADQASALKALGCDEAQGDHFGAPQTAEDFARNWLGS